MFGAEVSFVTSLPWVSLLLTSLHYFFYRGCTEAVDPIVVQGLPKIIVTAAGQLCFEELRDSMTKSVSQSLEPEPQSSESKGPDLNHAIADSSDQPIIIFVPLRLGLESINPIYVSRNPLRESSSDLCSASPLIFDLFL